MTRGKSELLQEDALLRLKLIVLKRQVKRPALTWRDRALLVLLASKLRTWKEAVGFVQSDTLLRWHRELFRQLWRRRSRRKGKKGRQPLADDIVALIKSMARDNRTWGPERIRGEPLKLGVKVSKSTIQKYMNQLRQPLSPKQSWATFLRNHARDIWACDFLQTYDPFFRTVFLFVIIELASRRLVHHGVTRNPTDGWVAQQLREATPMRFTLNRESKSSLMPLSLVLLLRAHGSGFSICLLKGDWSMGSRTLMSVSGFAFN